MLSVVLVLLLGWVGVGMVLFFVALDCWCPRCCSVLLLRFDGGGATASCWCFYVFVFRFLCFFRMFACWFAWFDLCVLLADRRFAPLFVFHWLCVGLSDQSFVAHGLRSVWCVSLRFRL